MPIGSNQNPAGAFQNQDRYFVSLGYDRKLSFGSWSTAFAYTHSRQEVFRGFLADVSENDPNAHGFRQTTDVDDLYLLDGSNPPASAELPPHYLGAVALSWSPRQGLFASAELSSVGSRYLNKRNTALAEAYTTLGALVGWRTERLELRPSRRNLTDRRDPLAESELGDAQYYRLFPRRVDVTATVSF